MPTREVRKEETFYCEKCNWPYSTEAEALACEQKEPERVSCDGPKWETWQVGDIALLDLYDRLPGGGLRLAKIDHEYESHHHIRPYFVPIDGLGDLPIAEPGDDYELDEKTPMHSISLQAQVLDDEAKDRLIRIGKYLESL